MAKGTLHMMVGVPASGKSTVAQELKDNGAVWLSSDKIREELYGNEAIQGNGKVVFETLYDRTKEALENGQTVVYDATCLYEKARSDLLSQLSGTYEKAYCHYCDVPLETALERNSSRDRVVPTEVIERMYNNIQPPNENEDFDDIYVYRKEDNNDMNQETVRKLEEICEKYDPFAEYIDDYGQYKKQVEANENLEKQFNEIMQQEIPEYDKGIPDVYTNTRADELSSALSSWLDKQHEAERGNVKEHTDLIKELKEALNPSKEEIRKAYRGPEYTSDYYEYAMYEEQASFTVTKEKINNIIENLEEKQGEESKELINKIKKALNPTKEEINEAYRGPEYTSDYNEWYYYEDLSHSEVSHQAMKDIIQDLEKTDASARLEKELKANPEVSRILNTLNENGYEAYIVGGAVRDIIEGKEPHDFDITTNASVEQIKEALSKGDGKFIEGIGGEKFGTAVYHTNSENYEITTFRKDGIYADGRRPDEVTFAKTIEEDLARRDFTMNAIAYSSKDGLVDTYNGVSDIKNGVLRCVGDANERMSEDALRIMRGVRFATTRGLEIERDTLKAMQNNSEKLQNISKERIRGEFEKMFDSKELNNTELLHTSGVLSQVSPRLDKLFECDQNNPHHYTDVGHHTMDVLENCHSKDTRMAALFHDVGKPETKGINKKGNDCFYGHAERSAQITKEELRNLGYSKNYSNYISDLVKEHDSMTAISDAKNPDKTVRKFFMNHQDKPDEYFNQLLEIKKADVSGQVQEGALGTKKWTDIELIENGFSRVIDGGLPRTVSDLEINGNDLREMGIEGEMIGAVEQEMLRTVMDNPKYNTRAELIKRAPSIARCLAGHR